MLLLQQQLFLQMLGLLLQFSASEGYQVTVGECYRPPETAQLYSEQGRGIKNSLHTLRLACDFNLYSDGKYQTSTEAYRPLGEYWESIGGSWGGRFGDGGHFSLSYGGRK